MTSLLMRLKIGHMRRIIIVGEALQGKEIGIEDVIVIDTETEQGIFEQVLKEELDFVSDPWPNISESAKDLVRKMLIRDPKKRMTAHQVLCEYACLSLIDATWFVLKCILVPLSLFRALEITFK